ncbi:hypothetical protein AMTRI_Chr05g57570 [Amborella trichopoda]
MLLHTCLLLQSDISLAFLRSSVKMTVVTALLSVELLPWNWCRPLVILSVILRLCG